MHEIQAGFITSIFSRAQNARPGDSRSEIQQSVDAGEQTLLREALACQSVTNGLGALKWLGPF